LTDRPVYRLDLRPEPGVDGILALRRALKALLRSYGLRCLSIEEVPAKLSSVENLAADGAGGTEK
jgi:hypothetical protein